MNESAGSVGHTSAQVLLAQTSPSAQAGLSSVPSVSSHGPYVDVPAAPPLPGPPPDWLPPVLTSPAEPPALMPPVLVARPEVPPVELPPLLPVPPLELPPLCTVPPDAVTGPPPLAPPAPSGAGEEEQADRASCTQASCAQASCAQTSRSAWERGRVTPRSLPSQSGGAKGTQPVPVELVRSLRGVRLTGSGTAATSRMPSGQPALE